VGGYCGRSICPSQVIKCGVVGGLDYIIKAVKPVYKMLRFADQDKQPNMGDVVMAFQEMKHELESYFGSNVSTWNEYK
jgi:hypothetical protein